MKSNAKKPHTSLRERFLRLQRSGLPCLSSNSRQLCSGLGCTRTTDFEFPAKLRNEQAVVGVAWLDVSKKHLFAFPLQNSLKVVPAHAVLGVGVGESVGVWGSKPGCGFPNLLDTLSRNSFV